MKKRLLALASILTALAFSGGAQAREWTIVGPRALGMGGANVAVANDASASYWNPAAFGLFNHTEGGEYGKRKWSAVADAGFGVQVHEDLGEEIDKIVKIDFSTVNGGTIAAPKVANYINLINDLNTFNSNSSRALTVMVNGGLRTQVSHFGIAGYLFTDLSAKGDLDLVNIAPVTAGTTGVNLITQLSTTSNFNGGVAVPAGDYYFSAAQKASMVSAIASLPGWNNATATNYVQAMDYGVSQAQASGTAIPADITNSITNVAQVASNAQTGGSLADNTSRLLFKGVAVGEVPVTYGYSITDDLAIGGNIKYMKARVYNTSVKVFNTKFSDALTAAKKDYKDSQNFGIDLGVLYRFGDNLRVGLAGHNLNSPKFDMKPLLPGDDDKIEEKAQVRAGVAYKPLSFVTLALDCDLTKNDTTASSVYKSQNLGGGLEVSLLKILQLRAGAYKNLAKSDIGPVYTAGLGLNLWLVNLDLGASLSPKMTTVDGNDIPKEVRAELALSALF